MRCRPDDIARSDDGWIEARNLPRSEQRRIPRTALVVVVLTTVLTLLAVAAEAASRVY